MGTAKWTYGNRRDRSGMGDEWKDQGQCKGIDMFPASEADQIKLKRVCDGCPVYWQCLHYATINKEFYGVWGGTTEFERKRAEYRTWKRKNRKKLSS